MPSLWPQAQVLAETGISPFPNDRFEWRKPHAVDWTSNGQQLAYVEQGSIWIVHETNPPTRLIEIPNAQLDAVYWSPNDFYLAVSGKQPVREGAEGQFIWVVNADGNELKELSSGSSCLEPQHGHWINQWLDEHTLAVECWRMGLIAIDISNNQISVLTDGSPNSAWGTRAIGGIYHWAPTRKHVVIEQDGRLAWVTVEQHTERWLAEGASGQTFLSWSQDGRRFVYARRNNERARFDLWLGEMASETEKQLVPGVYQAALSPDGQRVAFLLQQDRLAPVSSRLYDQVLPERWPPALTLGLLDIETGEQTLCGPAGYRADEGPQFWQGGQPAWSPDGKLLIYWGEEGDIWATSTDCTQQQRLTWGMEIIQVLWSPDGSRLALRNWDHAWIVERPVLQ